MNDEPPVGTPETPGTPDAASGRRRRASIDHEAVAAAAAVAGSLASPDAAALLRTLVELRLDRAGEVDHDQGLVAFLAGFPPDPDEAAGLVRRADAAFADAFGTRLVSEIATVDGPRLGLGGELGGIVDLASGTGRAKTDASVAPIVLGEATRAWVAIVAAATRSGRGHHLGLRAGDRRTPGDFADALAEAGLDVVAMDRTLGPALALLSCELGGGPDPAVVIADGGLLVGAATGEAGEWDGETAWEDDASLPLGHSARSLLPALGALRNTYVWTIPERGRPPRELSPILGGLIEGVAADPSWCVSRLLEERPWLDRAGARRLLAAAGDPRDAEAMAALAQAAAGTPLFGTPEEACRFVAAPFIGAPAGATGACDPRPAWNGSFDERLLACDADALALLRRGEALAKGCRVVAVGPPSGGKTSYAAALAESVARASGRTILRIEPADLLARAWGATERKVAETWRRARREHLVLLADEVDSLCTRRDADAPASGNAYLIRCLTNEFLRQLDNHPDVPLLATANDEEACDRAFLRRVTMIVRVGDALSPEQERLAWESLLRTEPPDGWEPCGAAVGDFASALARCRLLGRDDADSLCEAVSAARRDRLGPAANATRRRGPLH